VDPQQMTEGWDAALATAGSMLVEYGMNVVGAIVLLVVGRAVAGWGRTRVRQILESRKTDPSLIPFFSAMVYWAVLGVAVIAVLNLFGVETTSIIAVLGAAGFAVGLALQGTLSNFAAGVMLLLFRPVRVGDYVVVGGEGGTVREIDLFNLVLDTPDNVRIIIPNSNVYGNKIKNFSTNDTRRLDLVMGISYADDIGKAIAIIERVIQADSRTLKEPAPTIAVNELADSSVNIIVRPWCNASDYWAMRWDLLRKLKEELEAGGCSIPFPQTDLHVVSMPGAASESARA